MASLLGNQASKRNDDQLAREAHARAIAVQNAVKPLQQMEQGGAGEGTGTARPAPSVAYTHDDQAVGDLADKDALARTMPQAQFTVTDKDVRNRRQILMNQEAKALDDYVMHKYPVDLPGGMTEMMKIHPELANRINDSWEAQWKSHAIINRLMQMAPQNKEELELKFRMDQGSDDHINQIMENVKAVYENNKVSKVPTSGNWGNAWNISAAVANLRDWGQRYDAPTRNVPSSGSSSYVGLGGTYGRRIGQGVSPGGSFL